MEIKMKNLYEKYKDITLLILNKIPGIGKDIDGGIYIECVRRASNRRYWNKKWEEDNRKAMVIIPFFDINRAFEDVFFQLRYGVTREQAQHNQLKLYDLFDQQQHLMINSHPERYQPSLQELLEY